MNFASDYKSRIINAGGIAIETVDMHTGGEPLRVILNGFPKIEGSTILAKRNYCKTNLDHLRKLLMYEPRGHADMYGCLLVEANDAKGDFGVIFMHNEGYSTMCGHATIAIAKLAVLLGWVARSEVGETRVTIDAPCGRLTAFVDDRMKVRFLNVPSFVLYQGQEIKIKDYPKIKFDLAYGGAFYGFFQASDFGLKVSSENVEEFKKLSRELKSSINSSWSIKHPYEEDLSFLYGCIFIDDSDQEGVHSKNICVFADGEVDRCPTGSGVSARIAIHLAKGEVALEESIKIESVVGSKFSVKAVEKLKYASHLACIPEVSGEAHITGYHTFILEEGDIFKEGFLL